PAYRRPKPADINVVIDRVNSLSKVNSHSGINSSVSPLGVNILQSQEGKGVTIRIFEVQSAATGDGLYNCYRQKLDATNWADEGGLDKFLDYDTTTIVVLNLLENNPEATYVAQLAANDRMACWQWPDDEGNLRWVGIPIEQNMGSNRKAYCKADAGAATTIVCYLDTDATGTEITVNCQISGGGNLNACTRRLKDGNLIIVTNIGGTWYSTEGFDTTENCLCS
ncbi:hypothetical protein LCGC14_0420870, partial [marine sediment metagenome]